MVNNIRNNTISEISAKKGLNTLNEIKNAEIIKYKKRTPGHKKLLNLFNDLSDIILTDKTLESENQEDENKNENEKVENVKEENEDEDDDEKKEVENKDYQNEDYEYEDDDYEYEDDETIDQNEIIKEKNDDLDKIIDKSKSFEDQIKSLKKVENLDYYYYEKNFDDKELKFKIFKLRLAYLSNQIDENLFEQEFGHALSDKLINTTNSWNSKCKFYFDFFSSNWNS